MKLIRIVLKYLQYLLISKGKYNLHSPFLYNIVSKIILNSKTKDLKDISELRSQLNKNNNIININDFGEGSTINNAKQRRIKDIAKNSAKNSKFGMLLYRIVSYFKPQTIIEIGTSLGISTSYIAKANPDSKIYTLEGCGETIKIAQQNFSHLGLKNIKIIKGDFKDTLDKTISQIKDIDLAFVDGNHNQHATLEYFNLIMENVNENAILIFDDIHWSKDMEKAWNKIKKSSKVKLTIDLFFVGLVFIDKKLSKENYIIRF